MEIKKEFIEPTIKIVVLESQYIICESCPTCGDGFVDPDDDME